MITPVLCVVVAEGKLLAALTFIEPEKVYAMPEPSLADNEYKLMVTLADLTDRELVATIGWAKQVPGLWPSLNKDLVLSSYYVNLHLQTLRGILCSVLLE